MLRLPNIFPTMNNFLREREALFFLGIKVSLSILIYKKEAKKDNFKIKVTIFSQQIFYFLPMKMKNSYLQDFCFQKSL